MANAEHTLLHIVGRRIGKYVVRSRSKKLLISCLFRLHSICCKTPSRAAMQAHRNVATMGMLHGFDETTVDEYDSQAKLLQDFYKVPNVDKAWIFKSDSVGSSRAMFSISQMNIMANKKRKLVLSSHITKTNNQSVDFQWSPFPVEMNDVSAIVPSPSGSKLLVVRNMEDESPTQIEIWGSGQLEKAIPIPKSVHGSLFVDGWFEGMSWNHEETHIAYVAEEPTPPKPIFTDSGFKGEGSFNKDCGTWFGQGDWEENWGETYSKKRRPTLFVVKISSGEVQAVKGISKLLSVGQVVWVPSASSASEKYLVFVGWSSENCLEKTSRQLGIKYCYNRPCALYAVRAPFKGRDDNESTFNTKNLEDVADAINLTASLRSAFFPTFCPDGKYLVFLSAENAVDSGAHLATSSLHRVDWPADGRPDSSAKVSCVVPVVMCPMDGSFPGLYCLHFLPYPWLSDGYTMILSSTWHSTEAILSINILGGKVHRVTPSDSIYSWDVLAIDRDDILATTSCPIDPPQLKYGTCTSHMEESSWSWLDVSCPVTGCFDKIRSLLSSHQCSILKVPVKDSSEILSEGAKRPFEAIFISHSSSEFKESCNENKEDECSPVIVVLHGGPHSAFSTTYSKSMAFLLALDYNLLLVNYRGSLGFGEEAVQSLPGKVGSQDVNDVLAALDYVKEKGLIDGSKVAVLGGSHGGFLTTHLVGQAPDRFIAAAVRNPVCNLALMVGTTDIPDWCYIEAYGKEGKELFSEAPSAENLRLFYSKSPISHISKVKTPMLFLLGAKDLRVPVSNGLQYARALKERGVEVKIIVFPDDVHAIERPQSDFESYLNIGVWFNKHCKPQT